MVDPYRNPNGQINKTRNDVENWLGYNLRKDNMTSSTWALKYNIKGRRKGKPTYTCQKQQHKEWKDRVEEMQKKTTKNGKLDNYHQVLYPPKGAKEQKV